MIDKYKVAFIITDSEISKLPIGDGPQKKIIKRSSLNPKDRSNYAPLNFVMVVRGEVGIVGGLRMICLEIGGDENEIIVEGVRMVGIMPMPWEATYKVGANLPKRPSRWSDDPALYADDNIFIEGNVKVEKIILSKTQSDCDEIVEYFSQFNASH